MHTDKYKTLFLALTFKYLILSSLSYGQSARVDSLRTVARSTDNDSIRFEALISLSENIADDSTALLTVYDAYHLAEKNGDKSLTAKAQYELGFFYYERFTVGDSAKKYFLDAIESYKALNDSLGELKSRYGYSLILDDKGQMKEAIDQLLIALNIAELTQDSVQMTRILNVIGNINNYLGYHEVAVNYYEKSAELARLIGDQLSEVIVLYNTSIIYGEDGDYERELASLQRGLELTRQIGDVEFEASVLNRIGSTYKDLKQLDSAIHYLKISEVMYDSLAKTSTPGAQSNQGFNFQALGQYYETIDEPALAIKYFKKALEVGQKVESSQLILNNSEYISGVYESIGNYKDALHYYRMSTQLSDSIFTEENTLKLNEVQAKYENAKQIVENEQLRSAAHQQDIVIQKQRLYNIFFAVITAIILVSAFFLLLAYRKIVKQKKAAEDDRTTIKKQSAQLEHNARLKSQFFSNIAHELRTPLTILLGMIDSMTKKGVDHFDKADFSKLQLAKSNGIKIQNLIDEIFELTKSEAHKLKLMAKPVEVLPLMERIVFSFHSLAEDKRIDLNISYNQVHGIYANIDQPKFEKIINNLIVNALKFTENGGTITVKLGLKGDKLLTISVADTGVGIPADELEFVFDRFFQVSTGDNAANPGTGLGLAMAKELTKLHNGEISVKSEVGKGTTFSLEFPVVEALPELLEAEESEDADIATDQLLDGIIQDIKKIENGKVLIVEDNQDMRKYLVSIFEDYFTMVTARNGREALRVLETQQVNLIISDLMMPEMNGTELLVALKNNPKYRPIPVIMLTAKTDEHQKLDALKLGVDDYLTKPFSADEVLARANNLIRNHLQRTEYSESKEPETAEVADDDNLIKRITVHVKEHIGEYNITVSDIAHQMALSERQLYRKVNALTGLTPNQLIREIKLREAMEKLNTKSVTKVSVLAKEVGFESSAYFSKLFYARFGKKPQEII
ncbi:MAG: response regulator [Cyclobacteriaceae bacterium]